LSSLNAISTILSVDASVMRWPAITLALVAHLLHEFVDAPAAAVHDDGLHSDQAQQRHIAREPGLQCGIGHRVASEADNQRLAVECAQVWQRFREDAGFLGRIHLRGRGRRPGEC
jgi:hypothetical protein